MGEQGNSSSIAPQDARDAKPRVEGSGTSAAGRDERILGLRAAGLTFAEIALKLNVTKGVVSGVCWRASQPTSASRLGPAVQRPDLRSRRASQAATREKARGAAIRLFGSLGYERVTMRLIAYTIGMSTGALFSNWPGKAELYRDVYGHAPLTPEHGRLLASRLGLSGSDLDALLSSEAPPLGCAGEAELSTLPGTNPKPTGREA